MTSTTRLTLNMQLPNYATVAYAVQGDSQTRQIVCTLVDGSAPWTPPAGALPVVRYIKPDGTVGLYDTLEGGGAAVSTSGNVATITLAQQMLAVPGDVIVQLNFYTAGGEKLTTFNFRLLVQPEAVTDMTITSSDYFNVLTETIAEGVAVAQQLTFPVPISNGGTGATTEAGALSNLGLGGMKWQITNVSSGNSKDVIFGNGARALMVTCGPIGKGLYIINTTNAGSATISTVFGAQNVTVTSGGAGTVNVANDAGNVVTVMCLYANQ